MKKHWKLIGFLAVCAMVLVPMGAMADFFTPDTVTVPGDPSALTVFKFSKTLTVTAGTPTTAQADIMFLSDTTGSMGTTIDTVKTNASALLGATASLGNVQWAVGEYKDLGDFGPGNPPYLLNQAMTADQTLVSNAFNAWTPSGGGDTPEANLYGIQTGTTAATGWRAGSARIMVQFGDAPGHDPTFDGVTEVSATAALVNTKTKLIAADVGDKNATGQETRMTAASGGTYLPPADLDTPDKLVAAVIAAIGESFSTYHTVSLEIKSVDGNPLPFMVTAPLSYTGDFSRAEEETFDFDITLVGCCRAFGLTSFPFEIDAFVDGVFVASEIDTWTCVPVPPSMILMGSGLLGLIGLRRFKRI